MSNVAAVVESLAETMTLGSLLDRLRERSDFAILDHFTQGEFHHDVVLRLDDPGDLPAPFFVVATNCNGGVKEVMAVAAPPAQGALWHMRCPDNPEFEGEMPAVLARATTAHWFDPCELLAPDARSELREEHRERQPGGGYRCKTG